jgi:acyl-coenzyme A thioesterase PaaI-like protein
MSEWNEDLVNQVGWNFHGELPPGQRAERRRLADAIRRLADRCLTTEAPEEAMRAASYGVERILNELNQYANPSAIDRLKAGHHDAGTYADRIAMVGPANPLSPPISLEANGEISLGLFTFSAIHQGAPGWAHGGLVAAAFDQVFGYAALRRGLSCVTGSLTVNYLRPTPISRPLRIEVYFQGTEGRQTILTAKLFDGDRVLCDSHGLFIAIDPQSFMDRLKSPTAPPKSA